MPGRRTPTFCVPSRRGRVCRSRLRRRVPGAGCPAGPGWSVRVDTAGERRGGRGPAGRTTSGCQGRSAWCCATAAGTSGPRICGPSRLCSGSDATLSTLSHSYLALPLESVGYFFATLEALIRGLSRLVAQHPASSPDTLMHQALRPLPARRTGCVAPSARPARPDTPPRHTNVTACCSPPCSGAPARRTQPSSDPAPWPPATPATPCTAASRPPAAPCRRHPGNPGTPAVPVHPGTPRAPRAASRPTRTPRPCPTPQASHRKGGGVGGSGGCGAPVGHRARPCVGGEEVQRVVVVSTCECFG